MRSTKNIVIRPHSLYGRKFNVGFGGSLEYVINRMPSHFEGRLSDFNTIDDYCWISWVDENNSLSGVEYKWDLVIKLIKDGDWVLI